MKLTRAGSKNNPIYYVQKSIRVGSKTTSKTIERLGNLEEIRARSGDQDPLEWARAYTKRLTEEEKESRTDVLIRHSGSTLIDKNQRQSFNVGYLFLQDIYYDLGLHKICDKIAKDRHFDYDLNDILRDLVYGRILFPCSKAATYEVMNHCLEQPSYEPHDIYRALDVLAENNELIQSELYKRSKKLYDRRDDLLFYDCTNFFFEIEEEDELRRYGKSKEHRPNPIVQMGIFMDADGVPLAFSIHPGNTNEQKTLKPLEKQILQDYDTANREGRLIVCTDAGLASRNNRKFNDIQGRSFITVQSLKTMNEDLKTWALSSKDWKCLGTSRKYTLDEIREHPEQYGDTLFYKEKWNNDNELEQRYIVTFSLKSMYYQQSVRERQVSRAYKVADRKASPCKNPNDPERFLVQEYVDENGVICQESYTYVDTDKIAQEAMYDGFYCTATNLEDDVALILKANRQRWEIEECFRIMKNEFKARPVCLSQKNRILAHFITCFVALIIYRILEQRLEEKYTCCEILQCLRTMDMLHFPGEGYVPAYTRTELTDDLHKLFGARTDFEIVSQQNMRKIIARSKK